MKTNYQLTNRLPEDASTIRHKAPCMQKDEDLSKKISHQTSDDGMAPLSPKVVVLRWGHRYVRDSRLTSHICLIARAFGASSIILADIIDKKVKKTVEKITERWGGNIAVEMGVPWKTAIKEWKRRGGIVCHLTMYGENIEGSDVLERIIKTGKDVMVVVGAAKVPSEMFTLADFNVAIGNQPHSECAALAVFLDRLFNGKELSLEFRGAKMRIIPQKHGKKVIVKRSP